MSIASHTGVSQVFHGCFASVFTGVFTGVSRVFIWAQEPFTQSINRDHSHSPFTETIHRDHSPSPFTETLHPNPFTQKKTLHIIPCYTPVTYQYPTHFPFSILLHILTQNSHTNPSQIPRIRPFVKPRG